MIRTVLFTVLFSALLLPSQHIDAQEKQTAKALSPFELSDKLTEVVADLYDKARGWTSAFNSANATGDYSKLAKQRIKLEKLMQKRLAEVKALKDTAGSEEFRKSIISFLNFEKTMIHKGFKPFEAFTKDTKKDDFEKAMANLHSYAARETAELDKIRKLQKAYAAKNHFKVDEPAPKK